MKESVFMQLKDAATTSEFFDRLQGTHHIAMDVVFVEIVNYCDIFQKVRNNKIFKMFSENLSSHKYLYLYSHDYDDLVGYIKSMEYKPEGKAFSYIRYTLGERKITRGTWTVFMDFVSASKCEEDILPHLKLALAYNDHTNRCEP